MITVLLTGILLAANGDVPVYNKDYTRKETVRPTSPDTYRIYDNQWRNTGTIRTHPDGSIDVYNPDWTRRLPTIRPSTPAPPERPAK